MQFGFARANLADIDKPGRVERIMVSDKLYRVQKKDLPKLEQLLSRCFADDPLYHTLIPDPDVLKRLLPELFHCDMDEFYATCEIFSENEQLQGVLVVSDEAEPYNIFQYYFSQAIAALQTDTYLILEDPSLKTFRNFIKGEQYLNASWTHRLHQDQRLHVVYLAVDPVVQHHGIAALLMNEVIDYAKRHKMMISLETHNEKNLEFYQKFGFQVFDVLEKNFSLKQYCLIRPCEEDAHERKRC